MERIANGAVDYKTMYECTVDFARSLIREANEKGEKILRLEAELRGLKAQAEELRFNPYHDPVNGRFTSGKSLDKSAGSGIIRVKQPIKISLQFFAEKGLANQSSSELRKGIRGLNQRIAEHEFKIISANALLSTLTGLEAKKQAGLIRHWQKEIKNFTESINNRKEELKKRGDPIE